jgi:hypothetical protein
MQAESLLFRKLEIERRLGQVTYQNEGNKKLNRTQY